VLLFSVAFVLVAITRLQAQEPPAPEHGLFVQVANPISDASRMNIENLIDRAKSAPGRKLKKVIFDFNPNESEAATTNYGSCLDLARYIRKLSENGISTIAFVHAKTTRHTVLPVLACNDLAMTPDAKIGDVAGNEIIPDTDAREYALHAGHQREAAVLKMIDKNIEIVSGLEGGSPIYVDSAKAGKEGTPFANVVAFKNNVKKARGEIGLYDTKDAATFQICTLSVASRQELAERLNITVETGASGGGPIKAVKIELAGIIDEPFKQKLMGQLRDVRSKNENLAFIVIECGGGSAKIAREIADELKDLKNDKKDPVRTIAFIPSGAPDLATFIAFGCSEIVMFKGSDKGSEASLGDFEQFLPSAAKSRDPSNTVDFIRKNLEQIAEARGYDKLLVDAMVDRDLQVYRAQNQKTGAYEIITGAQYEAEKNKYRAVVNIKQPGSYRKFSASDARDLRMAQGTVDNRDVKEVYSMYGLTEKEVRDAKPSWIDDFAALLRRTEIILFVLLPIAFVGLFLEIKMPGAMIPGLVSLIAFVLFFWSQAYANGATIYLAIALFVLGLILLAAEIFILPGFGVAGVSGILLVLSGIGLATLEKAPSSSEEWTEFGARLVQYGLSLMGAGCVAAMFARYLPKIPYANRLMLVPPSDKPDIDGEAMGLPGAEQAAALLGQVGTATSMLRPAGMARFGEEYVDVVTEGDFIEPGTAIQVIEVEGTRIVVKKV